MSVLVVAIMFNIISHFYNDSSKPVANKEEPTEVVNEVTEQPIMVRRTKDKLREELKGHKRHHTHHTHHKKDEEKECEPIGWEPTDEMIKKTKKQLKKDLHEAKKKKRLEKEENEMKEVLSDKNEMENRGHGM